MFHTLLVCVAVLHGFQDVLASESNSGRSQGQSSSVNNGGRYTYPSLMRPAKEPALDMPGSLSRSGFVRLDTEAAEDFMEDYSLSDSRTLSLEASSREERSPRRCVQLLETCMGHLPCCSPCATCYCRFFKVNCYCRKISQNCHQRKN
ncbi:hypothetical protein FKM82_020146 [Ascaphus truei]